jgi:hypothetical protein
MLEQHLAEKNTKKAKLQHSELPAYTKLLNSCYTEKTRGLPCHQTLAPNLLGKHPADQQVSKLVALCILTATLGINQHIHLDILILTLQKKKKKGHQKNPE